MAGKSPVDRGKLGTKRSVLADDTGKPERFAIAATHIGETFTVWIPHVPADHRALDAGYDSKKTRDLLTNLGCEWLISNSGEPLQAGDLRAVERIKSWHHRGFIKRLIGTNCKALVIDAMISLSNSVIALKRVIRHA